MARDGDISIERQLQCVKREIRMREQVYPRLVKAKKMTQAQEDEELEEMRAVEATLEELREQGDLFKKSGPAS